MRSLSPTTSYDSSSILVLLISSEMTHAFDVRLDASGARQEGERLGEREAVGGDVHALAFLFQELGERQGGRDGVRRPFLAEGDQHVLGGERGGHELFVVSQGHKGNALP
jgi:hypothetical protein